MKHLEHAIAYLHSLDHKGRGEVSRRFSPLALLLLTVLYLCAMLSVPAGRLSMLLWFALYPVVAAPVAGTSLGELLRRSVPTLPFILFIAAFNPLIDRQTAFWIGAVPVSQGWLTFVSITVRGLLSVMALLLLIESAGFAGLCRGMEMLRLPSVLSTQLMMVYRYLTVLLEEALTMNRARLARGYGRRHMSMKMWATFAGQLLLRTFSRAERLNRAMLARGFDGMMPRIADRRPWTLADTLLLAGGAAVFAVLRWVDLSAMFVR